jgi:hypothetical protein
MSVSITIMGNYDYCQKHNLVENDEYPFVLNMSNGNFSTFANALGLVDQEDDMWTGEVYPQKVKKLLLCFDPELAVRGQEDSYGRNGCRVIECGLQEEQINRYIALLMLICEEAERREEKIVWG